MIKQQITSMLFNFNMSQHGAAYCIYNVQMYANKFAVYAKFLEVVHSFVCQYNILLLSFVYCDPDFFILLNNLTGMSRQCLIVLLMFLRY